MLYDKKWDQPAEPAKVKLETWRQNLLDAADLLDKDGWCQGVSHNSEGEHCVAAAIELCAARLGSRNPFQAIIHLCRHLGADTPPITSWNDAPGRTKKMVTIALREAAKS